MMDDLMHFKTKACVRHIFNRFSFLTFILGIAIGFSTMATFLTIDTQQISKYFEKNICIHKRSELKVGHDNPIDFVHPPENAEIEKQLSEMRLLCLIVTDPMDEDGYYARHINQTWGKRCMKLLFMGSREDDGLEMIGVPVPMNLWHKTRKFFEYVYDHHLDEYDWFLKANDDTFVIVENLKYMLYPYSPNDPIYFGCKYKNDVEPEYMLGNAGYVLSREAVKRLVELGFSDDSKCSPANNGDPEDAEIGKCLENVNVVAGDSRDSLGRERFLPAELDIVVIPNNSMIDLSYRNDLYYNSTTGWNYCSDSAITLQTIMPQQMYVLEYLIYHLRPFGIFVNP